MQSVYNVEKDGTPLSGWYHGQNPINELSQTKAFTTSKFRVSNSQSQIVNF